MAWVVFKVTACGLTRISPTDTLQEGLCFNAEVLYNKPRILPTLPRANAEALAGVPLVLKHRIPVGVSGAVLEDAVITAATAVATGTDPLRGSCR